MTRRGARAALITLVLALHAAGAWLLSATRPSARATAAAPVAPVLRLRLLPAQTPPPARPQAPTPRPRPAAAAAAPRAIAAPPFLAITTPSPAAAPAVAAGAASEPASAPPLNLRLPPRTGDAITPAAAAAADPRAHQRSQPVRWEERLAQRLDARLHETLQPDGRQRLRRGTDCVDLAPARIAQIDPWTNGSAPRTAAPCE